MQFLEVGEHGGMRQCRHGGGIDATNDLQRRTRRRTQHEPAAGVVAGQPLLGQGGDVRRRLGALLAGHADGDHLLGRVNNNGIALLIGGRQLNTHLHLHVLIDHVLQDENGQIAETHSVSAGMDYPGVGPEHAWLKDIKRAEYVAITDDEALAAFHSLCRTEGIIPALESSHALAYAEKLAKTMSPDQVILVNLSGRGDKDINTVAKLSGITL